jgi:hypothetical protein
VSSGFSSNIKRIINITKKKFKNLKSHDCHVIMTQLLPVASWCSGLSESPKRRPYVWDIVRMLNELESTNESQVGTVSSILSQSMVVLASTPSDQKTLSVS